METKTNKNINYPSPPEPPKEQGNPMMSETFDDSPNTNQGNNGEIENHFENFNSKLSGSSAQLGFVKKVLGIFCTQMTFSLLLILLVLG